MEHIANLKIKLGYFGRSFALLLNRTLMYQSTHPLIKQSVADVCVTAARLLDQISPLVFILNRGQFFIDEEPLDPRINVNRVAVLFKKVGIQSISFEKGVTESELTLFSQLASSLPQITDIDAAKETLIKKGVFNIKINHVIFKKVTEDDQVVSRDALKKVTPLLDSEDQETRKRFMDTLLESVLSEEFAKTLSITNLMANPGAFSKQLIEADLAASQEFQAGTGGGGVTSGDSASQEGDAPPHGATTGRGAAADGNADDTLSGEEADTLVDTSLGSERQAGPGLSTGAQGTAGGRGDGATIAALGAAPSVAANLRGPGGAGAHPAAATGAEAGPAMAGAGSPGSATSAQEGAGKQPGPMLLHQLELMHEEVERHLHGEGEVGLTDLAQAIFDMKKQLLEGIQAQKALGIAYANEAAIIQKANELADQVLLELIKEEYQDGKISLQRFAHIIRRMIPEAAELRRLLPKIRKTLLEAGMPMAEFLNLLHELRNELQSDELSRILEESSESIGLDGDGLIEEIKRNPTQAAELIYLASELRKGGGDENLLADILVEYVEHLGQKLAKDAAESGEADGDAHVKQVMGSVESSILKKLGEMNVNADVLSRMEARLNAKMESALDNMRVQWLQMQAGQKAAEAPVKQLSVLQTLEHNVGEDEDLVEILQEIRLRVETGEIEENNFSQIYEAIVHLKSKRRESGDGDELPEGVLTSEEIMFILEKEIARAERYASPLSALAFTFVSAKPQNKAASGQITNEAVLEAALDKLSTTFRAMDYIGQIGKNKILALLPMAPEEEAKKALARVLRVLHAMPMQVNGVPVQLRVAGVADGFDPEQTPTAQVFTKQLAQKLSDMVARLKSIQVLF